MENNKMISVGELAKQANISIRTIQYYDRINLLKPSALSDGGRRLYNSSDIAILHQIITLKSLGFSLEDIKNRLMPVDKIEDVVKVLNKQEDIIEEQIYRLEKSLEAIKLINKEITENNNVDWEKYANMVKLINEDDENYWFIKYLDYDILSNMVDKHEKYGDEGMPKNVWEVCCKKAIELEEKGIDPGSEEGQLLAKTWWDIVIKITDEDANLLSKLVKFYEEMDNWPEEFKAIQQKADKFIKTALELYIKNNDIKIPEGLEVN